MESDPLAEELARKFMLAITLIPYPSNFDEMLETLIAANDRPDMFLLSLSPARLYRLASDGIIRGIPDNMLNGLPMLASIIENDPIAQANKKMYGAVGYIPCVHDIDPVYNAEGGRIFYRRDWAGILGLRSFQTTEELYIAARAFAGETNPNDDEAGLIGFAVDKPERFAYLFGLDPSGWVWEGERYIPAYYSEKMKEPLEFARRLYQEGLLVLGNNRITLNDAGLLITHAGMPEDIERIITPVARSLRKPAEEVLANHVGIINPPNASTWGKANRMEGWLAQEGLSDGVLIRFLSMLEHSVSREGRVIARYGIYDETYTIHDGKMFLYTDPMTYRAYDVATMYPTGQFLLGLLTRDMGRTADMDYPSVIPMAIRKHASDAFRGYYRPINETDALCRAVYSPAFDALAVDYNAYFYNIITGEEPVRDMFARYKDECIKHGVENAIAEVNQAVKRMS
jgi:hypothetical protein